MDINLLLEINVSLLYQSLLSHPAVGQQGLAHRMKHPQIGDMVVEYSGAGLPQRINTIGKLLKIEYKPPTPETENKFKYWTIETPEGVIQEWENADFLAIPINRHFEEEFITENSP